MAFSDFYPEGHQGGVCVNMNGRRVATNGDIRRHDVVLPRFIASFHGIQPHGLPRLPVLLSGEGGEPGPGYRGVRGFEYYFLTNAYPDIFPAATVYNALNFILGCHPGSNTASFASGGEPSRPPWPMVSTGPTGRLYPVGWYQVPHSSGPIFLNCWSFLSSGSRRSMCWAEDRRTICSLCWQPGSYLKNQEKIKV